ncbi:Soluble lytic murein transglycosylase [Acaryochloris thomasi RCC1774]|uniref:Soluble lytic murein transglycosylase n=2 Tax=Acaryochloris TaxID=155977 RepID=A0A2W1JQ96_9CYAN|nr:Soluble lytic murein transglycosylase [Acaryochloris thomasi RCC1774]
MSHSKLPMSKRLTLSLVLGTSLLLGCGTQDTAKSPSQISETSQIVSDAISPLTSLPSEIRADQLKQLARGGSKKEKRQAKYLLATDLIEQQQGEAALEYLDGLDKKYSVLRGEVRVLQAKAHTLANETEKAQEIWEKILDKQPEEPAAAEALFALGQQDPQFLDQIIEQFPSHPRAIDTAVERLKANPADVKMRVLIVKYGHWHPDYGRYLQRLITEFEDQLQPEDWQAVAFGYWDRQVYKQAALAYEQSPQNSLTAFRAARSLQLSGGKEGAIASYKQMIADYPDAEETATALLKLGELRGFAGLPQLDQALKLATANKETHRVGQILLAKHRVLKEQQSPKAAKVQEQLLKDYGQTEAAAEFRWDAAQKLAEAKNLKAARNWALQVQKENSESELAAPATFWAGKWGERLQQPDAMKEASQSLWKNHPESYYTWRTASLAGWKVGDFSTVRSVQPRVNRPPSKLPLPNGSPALQELYQLGQSQTAYERWQWEFKDRDQRSFEAQLTDGILRVEAGDYLRGMFMILNLYYRAQEEPEQNDLYQQWRQDSRFWQALYPLAYFPEVSKWAKQRNLNSLMVLGLIRQESRFQPEIRSVAGAMGLMQVLPSTAEQTAQQIGLQNYEITDVDDNINLGTAYFDYTHQLYDQNSMLAIASYNAGPGNVAKWLRERPNTSADEFIEAIPFPETNTYVKVVLENYWNYLRLYNPAIAEQLQKQQT